MFNGLLLKEYNMSEHDLYNFMEQVTNTIAHEYERIFQNADKDPGTAGDQGEENWAKNFKDWIPTYYKIVTKGRIINSDGDLSPQVDILILHPAYPNYLLDKKHYLADGVIAAFECKTTLKAQHIAEAFESSKKVKNFRKRFGSPYKELNSPIIFGLLAHSHSWKRNNSKPLENIEKKLLEEDKKLISHPREMIDVICVADLATWNAIKTPWIGPTSYQILDKEQIQDFGDKGCPATAYICHSNNNRIQHKYFTPIGSLLSFLINKLAWRDKELRDLASYYSSLNLQGNGIGKPRLWNEEIYSVSVAKKLKSGENIIHTNWNEWNHILI